MTNRRQFLGAVAAAGVAAASWRGVLAAPSATSSWPTRPVRLVVPFTPGGSTDIAARVIANSLGTALDQVFVIENKSGAGGNIGIEAVARAENDGYTLGIVTTAHAINTTLFEKPGYVLGRDFSPVALIQEGPLVLVVNAATPLASVTELIAYAKANPGVLNYASSGTGNSTHMAGELFAMMADVKMTHVPYRGSAPAIGDTIAGVCQMSFDTMLSALPHIQSGKLRALAVTGAQRSALLPDVPTVSEAGLAGYEVTAWNGLTAPAGTPSEVVAKLNAETVKALDTQAVRSRFEQLGTNVRATTPAEFAAFIEAEIKKWETVLRATQTKVL